MDIYVTLLYLLPGTTWSLNGPSYDDLEWMDETVPKPTEQELLDAWPMAEYSALYEVQRAARESAYRAESDPLFFEVQRGERLEADWYAKVSEIKTRFPYPEPPA